MALYPAVLVTFVLLGLGVFNDGDDVGRGEWLEPAPIRIPFALTCIVAATLATRRRFQTLRGRPTDSADS